MLKTSFRGVGEWYGQARVLNTAPALDTDLGVDLTLLADYEFAPQCEHTRHNDPAYQDRHGGDAYYWAKCWHMCDGSGPVLYMLCKPAGDWFAARAGTRWQCLTCRHVDLGARMVQVLTTINP